MKRIMGIAGLGLLWALLSSTQAHGLRTMATGLAPGLEKPGDIERAALSRADFLIGEWEGEGWSQNVSGQRERFWVKEFYRYRGDKDLMDMEGRFGDIRPDGTKSSEQEYALGILFYDRESDKYLMWHYSGNGTVFTVNMDVDIKGKAAQYTRRNARGETSKFSLAIGEDGVWVSKIEILKSDKTWLQVMEFRMKRVKS